MGSSEEGFVRLTYRFVGGRPVLVRKKRVKRLPDAFAILVVRSDDFLLSLDCVTAGLKVLFEKTYTLLSIIS